MSKKELVSVQVGDIVVCLTMLGEICGRLKEIKEGSVVLTSGRLFVPSAEGGQGGGFAPSIGMTVQQEMDLVELQLGLVLSVCPAHEAIAAGWTEITSSIIV